MFKKQQQHTLFRQQIVTMPNIRTIQISNVLERTRALNDLFFSYIHQNVYSEVPSKHRTKAIASKFIISYQNKDFKKSKVYEVILSQIRLQRLN